MFCIGGVECLGIDMFGTLDGFLCVSSGYVFVGQKVSSFVELGGVFFHGFVGAADKGQFFVLNFNQFFGFVQDFFCLCGYDGNGISQVACALSYGYHGVPVLDQVAYFYVSGDMGCCIDVYDSWKGFGFFGVDGQDSGSGVLGTDGAGVNHAFYFHVVYVFSVSQDFFSGIDAVYSFS